MRNVSLRLIDRGARFFADKDLEKLRAHAGMFFAAGELQDVVERIDVALSRYAWLAGTQERWARKTIKARSLALERLWKACDDVKASGLEVPESLLLWVRSHRPEGNSKKANKGRPGQTLRDDLIVALRDVYPRTLSTDARRSFRATVNICLALVHVSAPGRLDKIKSFRKALGN